MAGLSIVCRNPTTVLPGGSSTDSSPTSSSRPPALRVTRSFPRTVCVASLRSPSRKFVSTVRTSNGVPAANIGRQSHLFDGHFRARGEPHRNHVDPNAVTGQCGRHRHWRCRGSRCRRSRSRCAWPCLRGTKRPPVSRRLPDSWHRGVPETPRTNPVSGMSSSNGGTSIAASRPNTITPARSLRCASRCFRTSWIT